MTDQTVYRDLILEHYHAPHNYGTLHHATHRGEADNPLCGDKLHMDIVMSPDGTVKKIAFSGEGCAISQAYASLLTDYARGKSTDALKQLDASAILKMIGLQLSPNRLKCALLALEVLHKAIH